jgi:hypothetical protein
MPSFLLPHGVTVFMHRSCLNKTPGRFESQPVWPLIRASCASPKLHPGDTRRFSAKRDALACQHTAAGNSKVGSELATTHPEQRQTADSIRGGNPHDWKNAQESTSRGLWPWQRTEGRFLCGRPKASRVTKVAQVLSVKEEPRRTDSAFDRQGPRSEPLRRTGPSADRRRFRHAVA